MDRYVTTLTEGQPIADQLSVDVCRAPLKRHQLTLLHACRSLENVPDTHGMPLPDGNSYINTRMGVICDKPGAGKSYVALALCTGPGPAELSSTITNYGMNTVSIRSKNTHQRHEINVIVVPHTLILQWSRYMANFPTLRHVVLRRNKSITEFVRDEDALQSTDVVLIVNTMYNHFVLLMTNRTKHVRRVIIDEAASIDITGSMYLSADFTWFMTATHSVLFHPRGFSTWNSALNTIEHTTALRASGWINQVFMSLNSAPVRHVAKLFLKNEDSFVDDSFLLPDLRVQRVLCQQSKNLRVFGGLTDSRIIMHLNAHDIAGAMSLLNPALRDSEENIISSFVKEYQQRHHNLLVELESCERMHFHDQQHKERREAAIRAEMEKLEGTIKNIRDRVSEEGDCPICMSDMCGKVVMKCCQKPVCMKCSHEWLKLDAAKKVCPFCKHLLSQDGFLVVDSTTSQSKVADLLKDKLSTTIDLIVNSDPSKKFLVFSHHDSPLIQLQQELTSKGLSCKYIKGKPAAVDKVLNSFVMGTTKVIFANSAYCASGLNIEATTDVIIFHKMNSDIENQIIGRAQRPGRTAPLSVWYMLYENEF